MQFAHSAHSQKSHNHFPGMGKRSSVPRIFAETRSIPIKTLKTAEHFLAKTLQPQKLEIQSYLKFGTAYYEINIKC